MRYPGYNSCRAAGRGRFADMEATAKAVQAAARGSYRLPKTVNNSTNQAMSAFVASMRATESQIKVLVKAIEQQFEIIPNTLTSIPGIGKVYSALKKTQSAGLCLAYAFFTFCVFCCSFR